MSGIIFKRKSKKKKKKKKKGSLRMVEQTMENPEAPSPYLTLQVDPTDYDEILRSNTPSGVFDPSQLTNAQMKKYFKRLAERSKNKQVFVVGNAQQPPSMLRLA
jgi:hypothetical protein